MLLRPGTQSIGNQVHLGKYNYLQQIQSDPMITSWSSEESRVLSSNMSPSSIKNSYRKHSKTKVKSPRINLQINGA